MNIGFIGLGLMGEPMALNILRKLKCNLYVYDINENQINKLVTHGAKRANSISDIAKNAEIIITMLPRSEHVENVYDQLYEHTKENQLFIDMSTISPDVSIKIVEKLKAKNVKMIDAPVVKSGQAAIEGSLGIYVGGESSDYQKALPILECMGNNIIHIGNNGYGLIMKLLHNMLVGSIQNGVNEVLLLSEQYGIDINQFIKAISIGGGQNFYLDSKGEKIAKRDFQTAFSVENMHKDIHLANKLVEEKNLKLSGLKNVLEIYNQAIDLGLNQADFSATYLVINKNQKE